MGLRTQGVALGSVVSPLWGEELMRQLRPCGEVAALRLVNHRVAYVCMFRAYGAVCRPSFLLMLGHMNKVDTYFVQTRYQKSAFLLSLIKAKREAFFEAPFVVERPVFQSDNDPDKSKSESEGPFSNATTILFGIRAEPDPEFPQRQLGDC